MPYMICRCQSPSRAAPLTASRTNAKYSTASQSKPERVQRAQHERAVADPGEPVVPVPLAAERLGQRRRARRHDRPCGRVAQRLQRERAPFDVGTPGMVGDLGRAEPVTPELLGPPQLLERLVVGARHRSAPGQRDPRRLTLLERGPGVHTGAQRAEPQAAGHPQREVAALDGDIVVPGLVVRPGRHRAAVVEHRQAVGLHLDATADARRDPQERSLRGRVARAPAASSGDVRRAGPVP